MLLYFGLSIGYYPYAVVFRSVVPYPLRQYFISTSSLHEYGKVDHYPDNPGDKAWSFYSVYFEDCLAPGYGS